MREFIKMPEERRRLICEQTGAQTGLFDSSVEKDFWVCWVLEKLFKLPTWGEALTFKGGTSLSKAWKLIERFSEDIDIVINREALGFTGDNTPEHALSNKQTQKRLNLLKRATQSCVNKDIHPALSTAIETEMPTSVSWSLESDLTDPDHQSLLFIYPTVFPDHPEYLRQVVKIEMGARSDTDPSSETKIQPIITEVFPSLFASSTFRVRSILPVRTFWEKAMLLHEESFKPAHKVRRKRGMARHYYDLYRLIQHGISEKAVHVPGLFERIAFHRKIYFKYTWMDYDTLVPGKLRLVPREDQIGDWQNDYIGMQREMFYGDVPSFDAILKVVKEFQDEFNR